MTVNLYAMMGSETFDEGVGNEAVEVAEWEEFLDEVERWFHEKLIGFGFFPRFNGSNGSLIPHFMNVPGDDDKVLVNLSFSLSFFLLFEYYASSVILL